ncbi:hypothetical protein [Phaeocystidibacter luteus]|uniref:Protein BatD n=1 Tax=Phaeocystidibacter luteus TaxID=911197 RepID=A0A6N6REG7_9FLAO|nr:hypothetical protein [Phaeocystidibacter luteus]KAB2808597.1 protein BatD [Phaeocystidibacter luteus]
MKLWKLIAVLCLPIFSMGQASFEVSSPVERMQIGDQINLVLKAIVHKNDRIEWTPFPIAVQSGRLVNRSTMDSAFNGDMIELVEVWTLTSFDSGFAVVPPIEIRVNGQTLQSDPILIQVDLAKKSNQYRDIADPIGLEYPFWKLILSIIAALTVQLLLGLFLIRRSRKRESNTLVKDDRTPKQRIEGFLARIHFRSEMTNEEMDVRISKIIQLTYRLLQVEFGINTGIGSPEDWAKKLKLNSEFEGDADELVILIAKANEMRFGGRDIDAPTAENWHTQLKDWVAKSKTEKIENEPV